METTTQKPKLIKDLGVQYPTEKSKRKRRYGIYECPICNKNYRTQIKYVEKFKSTKCRSCANSEPSNTTHGKSDSKLYRIWNGQKTRCDNKNRKNYADYGGRGIVFSDEFRDFKVWLKYVSSLDNSNPNNNTLDRIDNDGNYERDNLRWADRKTQARNTRKRRRNNKSGFRGVSFNKDMNLWRSTIMICGKKISLGHYENKFTAALTYDQYIIDNNLEHTTNGVKI